MTGVTWRPLPPDAPEPPPGARVRDPGGLQWLRAYEDRNPWAAVSFGGTPQLAVPPTSRMTWAELVGIRHPLELAEDPDAYVPWPAPGVLVHEDVPPSGYEIRLEALKAAVRVPVPEISLPIPYILDAARVYESYLRGTEPDESDDGGA